MQGEIADDPVLADVRNFYKVELSTWEDRVVRMLLSRTGVRRLRPAFGRRRG
jgi:hypothetical protein